MKRLLPIAFCCFAALSASADLAGDIAAVLNNKLLEKSRVGVVVLELERGTASSRVIYSHNPNVMLTPASNMKVLTSSAAFDRLGPDFKFQTLLLQSGKDLVLVGDGDPMFGDASALREFGWDSTTIYKLWAEKLKEQRLTSFENFYVDDSVFDQKFTHPDWNPADLLNAYAAQIGGMTLNAGVLDFYIQYNGAGKTVGYRNNPPTRYATIANTCVGGTTNGVILDRTMGTNRIALRGSTPRSSTDPIQVTIHNPTMFAATVLQEVFTENGIRIASAPENGREYRSKIINGDSSVKVIAGHETTLAQVLTRSNKKSANPYAEAVCKRLGAAVASQPGSWDNGTAAIGAFLKKAGAVDGSFKLADGSGLSRNNSVTPMTMAMTLEYNYRSSYWNDFLDSLPIAGVDGTLDDRFKGRYAVVKDRVFAKTGYINTVSGLSGYLRTTQGKWIAFTILMNGVPSGSNSTAKELQEQIVIAIDRAAK